MASRVASLTSLVASARVPRISAVLIEHARQAQRELEEVRRALGL